MYIYHFSRITLHHVPSRVTGYSSRCYTAGSHCLSTPNAKSFAPTNPGLPAHPLPPLPPWQPQIEFYLLKSLIILYSSVLPLSSPGNANCSVCLLRYRLCLTSVSSTPSFCPSPGHGTCNHLPVSPLTLTLPSGKSHQIVQIGPVSYRLPHESFPPPLIWVKPITALITLKSCLLGGVELCTPTLFKTITKCSVTVISLGPLWGHHGRRVRKGGRMSELFGAGLREREKQKRELSHVT